jgi:hypothetical protein
MNWRRKKQNAHPVCAGEHREGKETASSLYSYPALTRYKNLQFGSEQHYYTAAEPSPTALNQDAINCVPTF